MSPEIISSLPYTHASDIWALGCVLYELMTHSPPFTAKTQMGLFQKIKEGNFPPLPRDRKTGTRLYTPEIEEVVRYFNDFFKNLVSKYPDYEQFSFNCVGSVGFIFKDILKEVQRHR